MTNPATNSTSKPNKNVDLGIIINGIVNESKISKNGKTHILTVSTDSIFVTVFSQKNGKAQGDAYSAVLSGLKVDEYKKLVAFEKERIS